MKHFLLIAIYAFLSINILAADGDERQSTPSSQGAELVLLTTSTKQTNVRPHRAPVRQNDVECYYLDGNLHINFEFPEGDATLNIYDMSGTKCLQQPFSTTMPFIYNIGDVTEPIKIEIETRYLIYEGFLSL